jgi:hypothetical protein
MVFFQILKFLIFIFCPPEPLLHSAAKQAHDQADEEDNHKDREKHFSDGGRSRGYSPEAEYRCYNSYNEED